MGAGFLAAFNHNLFVAAEQAGISEEQLYNLLNGDPGFVAKLVKVFVESAGPGVQNLAAMIAACRFGYVNPNITEANFSLTGSIADVERMLTLTQKDLGGQNMTTFEIETIIDRKGYRPVTLAEQLAYAKAKWNGKEWVVALGSSWVSPDGFRNVPCLCQVSDGRSLCLYPGFPECRWGQDSLFLVVRK